MTMDDKNRHLLLTLLKRHVLRRGALLLLFASALSLPSVVAQGQWTTNGENINNTNNGNVGIGTATPGAKLEVALDNAQSGGVVRVTNSHIYQDDYGTIGKFEFYSNDGDARSVMADMRAINEWSPSFGSYGRQAGLAFFTKPYNSTLTERLRINHDGNVGIGTANPAANSRLDVSGGGINIGGAGNLDATLHIKTSYGGYGRLTQMGPSTPSTPALNLIASTDAGMGGQWWVWGVDANVFKIQPGTAFGGSGGLSIDSAGNVTVAGNIAAKYQDVAEWVPSTQHLSAGTVVILDPERTNHVLASGESYDTRVAGVISAQPGLILGEGGAGKVKVATTGRVRVKVDATKAPIKVGDLLVTSDASGIAMKSVAVIMGGIPMHRPGTLIGKALEPLASGKGEILVLLSLQ